MRVEQQNQILEALQQAAGKDVKTASGIVAEKAKTIKCERQTDFHSDEGYYLPESCQRGEKVHSGKD